MNLEIWAAPACILGCLNRAVKWPAVKSSDTVVMTVGKSALVRREGVFFFDRGADDVAPESPGSSKWRKDAML
jgi:hypothetical protein